MSVSGMFQSLSPEVSGALRYERIAKLETVLKLKEKQHRNAVLKWIGATLLLIGLATVAVIL